MKHLKNTFMTLLIISVFLSSFYVKSDAAVPETEYEEYHDQIDFDNLNLLMTSETSIDAYADTDSGLFDYLDGRKNLKKLEQFFEQYPEKESLLAENMLKGTVPVAISYTIAPCKEVDGHYERIEKKKNTLTSFISSFFTVDAATNTSKFGNFSLATAVLRGRYYEDYDKYVYLTLTVGTWSDHSFIGGSNYPASNYDTVAQSMPSNFKMDANTQSLYIEYTDGSIGTAENRNYKDVPPYGDSFCCYDIQDDPFGPAQLYQFILATNSYAESNNNLKKAHSTYLHTWSTLDVEVTISTPISNPKETTIEMVPSIESAAWDKPLHNAVTFSE